MEVTNFGDILWSVTTNINKVKICPFSGAFSFKNKKSWHFEFSISHIFRQTFMNSENLTYMGQVLLKLQVVQLAILFHSSLLQQPKNRQRKTAVNLLIYLFENYYWKKCLVEVSNFFTNWPENNGPLKFL